MKKFSLIIFILLGIFQTVVSQNIGINATGASPDASAMLDISSTNKGLLMPRVALTATNAAGPITSPATSLLVYNTATAGTSPNNVVPGYYYWNGSVWVSFSASSWTLDGNAVAANRNFGTTTNYSLPFITNNSERMRISNTGNVGIGTSTFNATNPERLVVDAGTSTVNAIVGKGSINNYLQLNIQNQNSGTNASSDVVATANNGTETSFYIDMGINSSANTSGIMGGANDAYLYNLGQNMLIGTGTAGKSLVFMTGGTSQSANERMRIDGDGNVTIGTDANDGEKFLVDAGDATSDPITAVGVVGTTNNYVELNVQNLSNGASASTDIVATANNGSSDPLASTVYVDLGINSQGYANNNSNILNGKNLAYLYANADDFKIGNGTKNKDLIFFTNPSSGTTGTNTANGLERMRISGAGTVTIGTNTNSSNLEVNGTASKTGGGTWATLSDRRLKKEIKPFQDGLAVIKKINPVWFQYNGLACQPNDGKNYVGIIAQDMQTVAPYTIGTVKDAETNTEYLNYDSNAVTYILINAVKEQQAIIDELKKKLEEQNKRLDTLESKIK